jgi:hypothetical protein
LGGSDMVNIQRVRDRAGCVDFQKRGAAGLHDGACAGGGRVCCRSPACRC